MSTPPLSRRTVLRGTLATGVAAAFVPLAVRPVFAEPVAAAATNGYLTFRRGTNVYRANADGSGEVLVGQDAISNVPWTVDGSRFAFADSGAAHEDFAGIWTKRADDVDENSWVHVTWNNPDKGWDASRDTDLAFSGAGRFIYFSRDGRILAATADGAWLRSTIVDYPIGNAYHDRHPHIADPQLLIFDRRVSGGAPAIYYNVPNPDNPNLPGTAHLLISNAKCGRYSPDGTKIAYLTSDTTYAGLQLWLADADGANGARLGTIANDLQDLSWTPDGTAILVSRSNDITSVKVSDGAETLIEANGVGAGMQPVTSTVNQIVRPWGGLALDTAIAISQFNWADYNAPSNPDDLGRLKAKAVVIGRSDQFYDALAGSALAANKWAPLLITPPNSLYAGTRAELQRVLAPGGTVYLLGGEAAISPGVASTIQALGYNIDRCGGATLIETALEINKRIVPAGEKPDMVIVATGDLFYDALAAGAAAGAYDKSIVVLTWGDTMPAATAQYLNTLNPLQTLVVAAGGPGHRALSRAYANGQLPTWPRLAVEPWLKLVGADAIETALLLAYSLFSGPQVVSIATAADWYDALTGGAMSGFNYGPLLLTSPSQLDGRVADYLNYNSSNVNWAVVLGGQAALPNTLVPAIGAGMGLPGTYKYTDLPAQSTAATARAAGARTMRPALEKGTTAKATVRSVNLYQRRTFDVAAAFKRNATKR